MLLLQKSKIDDFALDYSPLTIEGLLGSKKCPGDIILAAVPDQVDVIDVVLLILVVPEFHGQFFKKARLVIRKKRA